MKFEPCPGCKTTDKCAKEGCQKQRNKMSYGGMAKKMKMYKGGYCGASNPAERPMKKTN